MGVSNEINVIWECVLSLIFIVINLTLPMYIAFFVYLTACRYYLFFIQAGTVHAIGAGALVAEIQENSNLKKSKQRSAKVQKNI